MQVVPLNPLPNQTQQITLGGQACQISVVTRNGSDMSDPTFSTPTTNLYFSLSYNGIDVTDNAICLDEHRLLINRQYLGFVGDFMFIDTQGNTDPVYTGLGSRYVLLYLEAADLS